MSRSGLPVHAPDLPGAAVVVSRIPLDRGHVFGEHSHPAHQLAWAARGVLRIGLGATSWVLTPGRALWIPAGVPHVTTATEASAMRGVYLWPDRVPDGGDEPAVLGVDPLLAALIDHLADTGLDPGERRRAEAVLFDRLRPARDAGGPGTAVRLVWPRDPRARRVADALAADPADPRDLAAWGRLTGAGERTLSRLFRAETGLGPGRWRAQLRVRAALELLGSGLPVATVARRVGYATPSAFVAAFRRATGVTPPAARGSTR
ncbi:AraC family transcriptional regulator [Pseudonocardia sp. HH130630-07]|uniref:AraC family transcriptional regulator n=1 Tax=Pseudonocardia sp. HH130630-07 TaxID=1690815 RepID=UPI000814BFAF|nr:helix-turn-helix transcriptional regulator [Pseudonocardia sp. HH130630-07]ANY09018.1 AraC family transcriptional regulator [Pseudonocardia sp. HH130630-07]